MINKVVSAAISLALLLTQVAHAEPAAPISSASPIPRRLSLNERASSPSHATYNAMYDDPQGSMDTVACSNGQNGLGTKYKTFGSVPSYPFIGGAYDISGPSSPNCGSCWVITNPATGLSIQMTSIDSSGVGFDLTAQAFADLTNGNFAVQEINVVANKLSASPCSES